MSILNSFIANVFEKIAVETASLARYSKKPTVTFREIQTAVRLIMPGELAKHAFSEGTKAVTNLSIHQPFNSPTFQFTNLSIHQPFNSLQHKNRILATTQYGVISAPPSKDVTDMVFFKLLAHHIIGMPPALK